MVNLFSNKLRFLDDDVSERDKISKSLVNDQFHYFKNEYLHKNLGEIYSYNTLLNSRTNIYERFSFNKFLVKKKKNPFKKTIGNIEVNESNRRAIKYAREANRLRDKNKMIRINLRYL